MSSMMEFYTHCSLAVVTKEVIHSCDLITEISPLSHTHSVHNVNQIYQVPKRKSRKELTLVPQSSQVVGCLIRWTGTVQLATQMSVQGGEETAGCTEECHHEEFTFLNFHSSVMARWCTVSSVPKIHCSSFCQVQVLTSH